MATRHLFEVNELLTAARDSTGLADFGPDDFREGLEVLVRGLNTETIIPPDRVGPLRDNILRLLKNRLWFQKDLSDHPEILDEQIDSPIVITSLPRTGSTKLHRLLGASGDFQALHYWKVHMFARRPGLPDGGRELRIAETRQYEKWVYEVSPNMITGHPMFTDEPEEEFHLMNFSFRTISMSIYASDTHNAWLATSDPTPAYDYLKRQLQYLQWQIPADRHKPWILKTPVHFGMEAQVCRIFANPRFIVTHRDPAKVVPSLANITQNWTVVYAEPVSNDAILKSMSEMCSRQVEGHMNWRNIARDVKILDIAFRDINADNLDVVRKVYDTFGLAWSASSEKAMWDWSKKNPRNKHGKHLYSAELLGTTDADIRAHFPRYIRKFGDLL
jgi:Sulfotransferase family